MAGMWESWNLKPALAGSEMYTISTTKSGSPHRSLGSTQLERQAWGGGVQADTSRGNCGIAFGSDEENVATGFESSEQNPSCLHLND